MTLPTVTIRKAEASDILAVRTLLVETWHDTYDALIGADKVSEITGSWHSLEALSRQLHLDDTVFLVAHADSNIVGHAFANASEPPVLRLMRLYVHPSRQRRGIGQSLMQASIESFPGTEVVRLDVEADNRNGVAFYSRMGFEKVGEHVEGGLNHLRMEMRVGANG